MSEEKKQTQEAAGSPEKKQPLVGRRAEKIGIVVSNKMMKTVVVRVDRVVRHQK